MRIQITAALTLAATISAFAQQKPFSQASTGQIPPPISLPKPAAAAAANAAAGESSNSVEKLFNGKIPDAIAKGKFNLNVRLRYEQVDNDNVPGITENSYAPTVRTRFGYTTAPLYGFEGMLETVNVSALGADDAYNAAGSNGQGARPSVPDPELTLLD